MTIHSHTFDKSQMLNRMHYDSEKKELAVTFSNDKTYHYEDVEPSSYHELIAAKSAGKHFNSIKGDLKIK